MFFVLVFYAKILTTINANLSPTKSCKWSFNMMEKFFIECFDKIDEYPVNGSFSHFRFSNVLTTDVFLLRIIRTFFRFVMTAQSRQNAHNLSFFHCQKKINLNMEKIQKNPQNFLSKTIKKK